MGETIMQAQYPWITFKLRGQNYCVSSENVSAMSVAEHIYPLPESSPHLLGLMMLSGVPIPVLCLRTLLGLPLLQVDLDHFSEITQKHLTWVQALEECIACGCDFPLPLDPHECELGQWYYNFHTDNHSLLRISALIDAPHRLLHEKAQELLVTRALSDEARVNTLLAEIRTLSTREIEPLLERLDHTYRDINRGIMIVMDFSGKMAALQVDRILAVSNFENAVITQQEQLGYGDSGLIPYIITTPEREIYLELDAAAAIGVIPAL